MAYHLEKLAIKEDTIPLDWTVDTMSITLNSTVTSGLVDEMQLRPRFPRNRLPGPRPRDRPPGPPVHFLSTDPETDDKDNDNFYSSTGSGSLTSQSIINNTTLQRSNNQHRGHQGSSNQQRRPPGHNGNCQECGRFGHKETHCNHLAIWANLQHYLKMATPATVQQAESEWLEKNKQFLGNSKLTLSKVAANFIATHKVDINHIFTTLDWDSWSEEMGFTLLDDSE